MKKKFKLRNSSLLYKDESSYILVQTASRKIKRIILDDICERILDLSSETDVVEEYIQTLNYDNENQVYSRMKSMEQIGLGRLFNEEYEGPYKKQVDFIDEFYNDYETSIRVQEELENKTVSIIGLGGVGSHIFQGLTSIGIQNYVLCDPDIIEIHNMNRQSIYCEADVGKYKVDVIKEKNPHLTISTHKQWVSEDSDLTDIVQGSDLVVNCADKPDVATTTRILNMYAQRFNVPLVVGGGYNMHIGMVGPIFIPGKTKKFDEFIEHQKDSSELSSMQLVKDVKDTGSLGPISAAIGNLQVIEIFKYFTGIGSLNENRFSEVNFLDFEAEWRTF